MRGPVRGRARFLQRVDSPRLCPTRKRRRRVETSRGAFPPCRRESPHALPNCLSFLGHRETGGFSYAHRPWGIAGIELAIAAIRLFDAGRRPRRNDAAAVASRVFDLTVVGAALPVCARPRVAHHAAFEDVEIGGVQLVDEFEAQMFVHALQPVRIALQITVQAVLVGVGEKRFERATQRSFPARVFIDGPGEEVDMVALRMVARPIERRDGLHLVVRVARARRALHRWLRRENACPPACLRST